MENEHYDRTKLPVGLENVRHGWLTQIGKEWLIETKMGSLVAKFSSKEAAEAWWFQHTSPNPNKLKPRIDKLSAQDRKNRKKKKHASGGKSGGKGVGTSFKGKEFVNEPFMPYNERYGMAEWDAR